VPADFAPWADVLDRPFPAGGVAWVLGEHGALVPVPSADAEPRRRGFAARLTGLLHR
jgi:hypothetical protein